MVVAIALIVGVAVLSIAGSLIQEDTETVDTPPTPETGEAPEPTTPAPDPEEEQVAEEEPEATEPAGDEPEPEVTPTAEAEQEPTPEPLSDEELREHQPNELGQVMVLMYHRLEPEPNPDDVYTRTPEEFREDLQWLYDNDFYVIPIRDYIRNEIDAPAGKRPVVLTFDDGVVSQFRLIEEEDGSTTIDPDTAVGILEEFFNRYEDFGRGGLFSVLPNAPFAWPEESDQMEYAEDKLQWLVDNGYELGNHTIGHINMREVSIEETRAELGGAIDMIQEYVPEAEIDVLAVPFGVYPPGGDTTIFEGWEYEGRQYSLEAALMVGAEPAPSPVHVEYDPMWIPRVNADDEQFDQWFGFVESNPGIMYVSDGNPDTVTIPEEPHPSLVDTFDEEKVEGKTVVRY